MFSHIRWFNKHRTSANILPADLAVNFFPSSPPKHLFHLNRCSVNKHKRYIHLHHLVSRWVWFVNDKLVDYLKKVGHFWFPAQFQGTQSADLTRKDERLSRPWSHLMVLNIGPLLWESRALTTRSLLKYMEFDWVWLASYHRKFRSYEISCQVFGFYLLLYAVIMSHPRFRVNPHSIVAWMSRNSLLETGTISEVLLTSLAKWLSVRLQTKWLRVRLPLQ